MHPPLLLALPSPGGKNINPLIQPLIRGLKIVNRLLIDDVPFRLPTRGAIGPLQEVGPSFLLGKYSCNIVDIAFIKTATRPYLTLLPSCLASV